MDWANGRNTGVSGLRRTGRTVGRTGRTPSYWAEYRTGRTSGQANVAKYGILDGADWGRVGDWRTQRTQRTTKSWTG